VNSPDWAPCLLLENTYITKSGVDRTRRRVKFLPTYNIYVKFHEKMNYFNKKKLFHKIKEATGEIRLHQLFKTT
jgi:hypothetical protein